METIIVLSIVFVSITALGSLLFKKLKNGSCGCYGCTSHTPVCKNCKK